MLALFYPGLKQTTQLHFFSVEITQILNLTFRILLELGEKMLELELGEKMRVLRPTLKLKSIKPAIEDALRLIQSIVIKICSSMVCSKSKNLVCDK